MLSIALTKPLRTPALLSSLVLLAACSSGGGGGDNVPTGGDDDPYVEVKEADRYYFYQTGTGGNLMAVVHNNPGSPFQVATSVQGVQAIGHGQYTLTTATTSNLHTRTVVYAKGGKLWKVSGLTASGLTPIQVSSEQNANTICNTRAATDFKDHNNAAYIYELPGPDTLCTGTDNIWRMVRIGMGTATAPINAEEPITAIDTAADGSSIGWLVNVGGNQVRHYNADFSSSTPVRSYGADGIAYYGPGSIASEVLRVDNQIVVYETQTGTEIKAITLTSNAPDTRHIFRSGTLYYVDYDAAAIPPNARIRKISLTGVSTTATTLDTFDNFDSAANQDNLIIRLLDNKVVYGLYDASASQTTIGSMNTDGTNAAALAPITGTLRSLITAGDQVYYSVENPGTHYTSGTVKDDMVTGLSQTTGYAWAGAIQPSSVVIGTTAQPSQVIKINGYNTTEQNLNDGGNIDLHNAITGVYTLTLGSAPAGFDSVDISTNSGISLNSGKSSATAPNDKSDIFFVDTGSANSLHRVTSTLNIDDIVIDAYR